MHCLFCPRFPCLGSPCTGSDHKVSTPLHRSSICDGSPVHMHVLCSVSAWFPYNDDCWTRLYTQRVLISYLCKLSESVAILTTVERISIRIFFFAVRNYLLFLLWSRNNNHNSNYCYSLSAILLFTFRCFGPSANLKWIETRGFSFSSEYGSHCPFSPSCWMCWTWTGREPTTSTESSLLLSWGCCRGAWWSFLCRRLPHY